MSAALVVALSGLVAYSAVEGGSGAAARSVPPSHRPTAQPASSRAACGHFGRPALALDARPRALRVFAIQLRQQPQAIVDAGAYRHLIDCALRIEVLPHLARGRPNLVVFDEDVGLQALAAGARGAAARRLLRNGVMSCRGQAFPCATLATLSALNRGYAGALRYLAHRFPALSARLGRSFVAATDTFVRVFMTTMAAAARRYGLYVVASNTQAPFALSRDPAAVRALGDPAARGAGSVYAPTLGVAYDETFVWGPAVRHPRRPLPLQNLIAINRKVPLTSFELALGFAAGPSRGPAALANLAPVTIPGTGARLGIATSLPAFIYGPAAPPPCADVSVTYMRCLSRLGANVLIQADANDGAWTGPDGSDASERWQPLSWMGSAWRAVSDPAVRFAYAVNPLLVGNLADTPFDGQSSILQRGRRGAGCHYVGDAGFVSGEDDPALRAYAGPKPQFLALAPWVVSDGPRARLRRVGDALTAGRPGPAYVQTALVADLPLPVDRTRRGCLVAGR